MTSLIHKIYSKTLAKIFDPLFIRFFDYLVETNPNLLTRRIEKIENHLFNNYANRWRAVDNIRDYLLGAEIPGDYVEFGVYRGDTFAYVWNSLSQDVAAMRFFAFDSFRGLPKPTGIDNLNGYTGGFSEGQFDCTKEAFLQNLSSKKVDLTEVITVEGWYKDTLTTKTAREVGLQKVCLAWIDCDLYESTVLVLDFLFPYLTPGSVIVFDDWHNFRNLPDYGQKLACKEWQEKYHFEIHPLYSFGYHGEAFTFGNSHQ